MSRKKVDFEWLDRTISLAPYFTLCLNQEQLDKALFHLEIKGSYPMFSNDHADASTLSMSNPEGELVCIVCMRRFENRSPIAIASLLVHEAVHIWQKWCKQFGERKPGIEQEAYAIQHISQTLMEDFSRQIRYGVLK